jgi:hypothetical protein
VEARRGGGAKKAQQWTEGSETGVEKIGRNCKKKTQKTQKQTEKKYIKTPKQNTGMEEAGEEEKGRGAPGLGTSSKLLEPGAKGTWGGGMAEAIPPPLQLWLSERGGGGWRLAEAKNILLYKFE